MKTEEREKSRRSEEPKPSRREELFEKEETKEEKDRAVATDPAGFGLRPTSKPSPSEPRAEGEAGSEETEDVEVEEAAAASTSAAGAEEAPGPVEHHEESEEDLARPAAEGPPGDGWVAASEVDLRTLQEMKAVHIQGRYWDNEAEIVGEITKTLMGEDGAWTTVRVHGTSTESILKYISGQAKKELQVHLCDSPCSTMTWGDTMLHADRIKAVEYEALPWSRNLEISVRESERDELEVLRREAGERGKGRGEAPKGEKAKKDLPEESGEEEEGRKAEKTKAKKKERKKLKKARDKVVGIKSAEALFATTGLDPKEETRRRLRRKAKKLGKRSRNKKGSSGTSSSSGSSDSSPTEEAEAPEELFTPLTATQRIWRRYPGVLTATMVLEAQRTMMLQLGASLPEAEKAGVKPIILQYCRQQLCQNMSPPVAREALHWAATMDMLLEGRVSSALDVMSQRLKSLEGLSRGLRADLLRQMELLPLEKGGLASNTEVNLAGQAAHQEAKILHRASSAPWERSKGKEKSGKGKWKEERSESKGDKGKKDKGEGKKKAQ